MSECALCATEVELPGDHLFVNVNGERRHVHRECMVREVVGGIGHLTDHDHWCVEMGDPNMGLSFRESALLVDQWVRDHR